MPKLQFQHSSITIYPIMCCHTLHLPFCGCEEACDNPCIHIGICLCTCCLCTSWGGYHPGEIVLFWLANKLGCFTYPDTFPVDGIKRDKWGLLHHKKTETCRACQKKIDHAGIGYDKDGKYMRRIREGGRSKWVTDPVQFDPTLLVNILPVGVYQGPGNMGWADPPGALKSLQQDQPPLQLLEGVNEDLRDEQEDLSEGGGDDNEQEEQRRHRPVRRNRPKPNGHRSRTVDGRSSNTPSSIVSSVPSRALSAVPSRSFSRLPSTLPPPYTSRAPGAASSAAGTRSSRGIEMASGRGTRLSSRGTSRAMLMASPLGRPSRGRDRRR